MFLVRSSVPFISVTQSCPTVCSPMDCSMPVFPLHHQLPEYAQIHVYWFGDAIQPSHPLLSSSPPAFKLSQHQGLFKWVGSLNISTVQFSSVAQLCPTLCDSMNCSSPGLPVHQQLPEFTQTHVHWFGDAIQPSHSLSCPPPPAFRLSQHQGLFQWSSHQVAKVLEFQLQHQSFQWTPRTDLL